MKWRTSAIASRRWWRVQSYFVEWLENKINDGDTIYGSVEFVGKGKNKIVYDGEPVEKGRVPKVYDYSGYCILTVAPSDDSAILIELNQKIEHLMN